MKKQILTILIAGILHLLSAKEYQVSVEGNDANDGSRARPFKTISAAATRAQAGDIITVHQGVYRERINPHRGGESDRKRIIYQAAQGEDVKITGSELVTNWVNVQGDAWKATLPNELFGQFNPYGDLIHGDWFNPKGRQHHTGAVYLNGEWLAEAAHLDDVLKPPGSMLLYNQTIKRALKNGWSRENIGHHIVRRNVISHCEQAGIVGSLGAAFSTITGNIIHDIHVQQLFSGAEMAGIKFHAAIDVEISRNHIYRTVRGIWLDWMAQGAHLTENLLHDNQSEDLFLEVDHGPYLVDNNLFLSPRSLLLVSQGGAYAHNLFAGDIHLVQFDGRLTPFHKAHSTEIAGLHDNPCGDDRFYNNLVVRHGNLSPYDAARLPVWMEGNVFLKGTKASRHEPAPLVKPNYDPAIKLAQKADAFFLDITLDKSWTTERKRKCVETELLGQAKIPNLPFEAADGKPIQLLKDYCGAKRNRSNPFPGPFELREGGQKTIQVWPSTALQRN